MLTQTRGNVLTGGRRSWDKRKFIYIAAQGDGNDQYSNRRMGLAVSALEMNRIDPNRLYAAGFSGGARMAAC
jgi:poly(3-hydroxybutyrate) depolymerase